MPYTDIRGVEYTQSAWVPAYTLEMYFIKKRGTIVFEGYKDIQSIGIAAPIGEYTYKITPESWDDFLEITQLEVLAPMFTYAKLTKDFGDPPVMPEDEDTRVSFFENATLITI